MIRKLTTLGLAMVAVLAMSAVAASAAQAEALFMSEGNVNAKITAEQVEEEQHVFTIEGSEVKCKEATFETEGEIGSPTTEIQVDPTYEECKAFGFINATVTTTGCHYILTVDHKIGTWYTGTIDVVCTGGAVIIISAGTCEATVGTQSESLGGIEYMSLENGEVEIAANVEGIETEVTNSGFLCPLEEGTTTGSYTGNTTAKGEHEGKAVNVTMEGE